MDDLIYCKLSEIEIRICAVWSLRHVESLLNIRGGRREDGELVCGFVTGHFKNASW